jgi:polysaccharide export outer membrane protein
VSLLVSSCIPKRKLIYLQDQKEKDEKNEYVNVRPEKTIQPFDNIYIKVSSIDEKVNSVFSESGRSSSESNINLLSYTVSQSGYIDFPFVGEIYVKDQTLQQAQQKIEDKVGEFLNNISITVKFVNNTVSVLGEVKRPGEYPFYRDQITILQALSYGGGFTDYGDKERVLLIREAENKINYYYLDLTRKDIVASEHYYIIPNDVLVVRPINQKFRNLSLVNWPLFLTTVTTGATLYLLFRNN